MDVNEIDRTSLTFGPGGATAIHDKGGHIEDAKPKDGTDDLVVHVRIGDTGLVPGDTEACVQGALLDDFPIAGCSDVCVRPKP